MIPQCCTHRPSVKCTQANACPSRAVNNPYTNMPPIENFPQLGTYTVSYCTKAHDQREPYHQGVPRRRPNPLPGHFPSRISPRRTSVLTQRPHKSIRVSHLTGIPDTTHAAPALTKTAAANPVTPAAVGSGKKNSNLAQPTDGQTMPPSPPANTDSDVMLVASIGRSECDSDYVKLAKKLPTSPANTPDLAGHTRKLEAMKAIS